MDPNPDSAEAPKATEPSKEEILLRRQGQLLDALRKYGRHEIQCKEWAVRDGCTCGLSQALKPS